MKFPPKTEEELQKEDLIPDGIYSYQVIKSEDKVSKAGNEYTSITLNVWDHEGAQHMVFTNMALIKLLKHFCDVNGMSEKYMSGNIPAEDFLYRSGGLVVIGIEKEKSNPSGGMYKAKNIVKDYVIPVDVKPSGMKPLPTPKDDFLNDEIPF